MASDNKTDIFQFMSLRSPQPLDPANLRHNYIQDEDIQFGVVSSRQPREIFTINSNSDIGKIIYSKVFCDTTNKTIQQINDDIVQAVLNLARSASPVCSVDTANPIKDNLVNDLEKYPYIRPDYQYYFLPSTLESIQSDFDIKNLLIAKKIIADQCNNFNRKNLLADLKSTLNANSLTDVVFYSKGLLYEPKFIKLRSQLFETLYLLYILRRKTTVNLEEIISGIQTLHTLEYLAADNYLDDIYSGKINLNDATNKAYLLFLQQIFPELLDVNFSSTSNHFYFIKNKLDLTDFFQATPIIHPIIAELAYYGKGKFNNIKPYLGDLKVVKQWLIGYKAGEISHIHNIMKGEEYDRNYRYLERSENVLSITTDSSQSTQSETQTADRFELKREAESVIKTDINVGANANMTYKNGDVFSANVGANFAYTNSNQDTQHAAINYAREITNKAVTQIQTRTTQQRSITKIYESEEKNDHKFTNTEAGASHTSGIYRWLDKMYNAQLYNFGKRWMFEFVIPEPAAFYVMSKLKAAEFELKVPKRPEDPDYKTVKLLHPTRTLSDGSPDILLPIDIDQDVLNKLRLNYDLEEFSLPVQTKMEAFISDATGGSELSDHTPGDNIWKGYHFKGKLADEGYNLTGFSTRGFIQFQDKENPLDTGVNAINKILFVINGNEVHHDENNAVMYFPYDKDFDLASSNQTINVVSGDVLIDLGFQDIQWFSLQFFLQLELDSEYKLDIQTKIYNKIKAIEQKKLDQVNQELQVAYSAAMSDYRNRLDELSAQTINDIIQGRSESFNQEVILDELKKHCISMISKEFDSDQSDDVLSNQDALVEVATDISYQKFFAGEVEKKFGTEPNITTKTVAVAEFQEINDEKANYPKIDIEKAKEKARYVQFLEQAFEWREIAYIFYSYFWAHESKWIKLMNRLDYTDNNMTAFLKAGSARVLIAVTPGYHDAVMHFLATREPWQGGPLPVVGDPLFIPIYEEIHKQQDDLQNAKADGDPWEFEMPTSLVYLQDSSSPIPDDLSYDKQKP